MKILRAMLVIVALYLVLSILGAGGGGCRAVVSHVTEGPASVAAIVAALICIWALVGVLRPPSEDE